MQHTIQNLCAQWNFANCHGEICRVRIQDARPVTLTPNSEMLLWCHARPGLENKDYQAFLDYIPADGQPLVQAARSIVTVSNSRVPVRLVNLSNVPVVLYKYHPVAQLYQLDPEDVLDEENIAYQQSTTALTKNSDKSNSLPWWSELNVGDANATPDRINGVFNVAKRYHQAFSKNPLAFGKNLSHPASHQYRQPSSYQGKTPSSSSSNVSTCEEVGERNERC
ncbi:uncharacterized protein LOC142662169 [Rhinoderma darwinii]|uniref:uncharacterized protein LOC142662169 n=1 Tax=Rhinoderma darwinii TaxID=43563 RepID=UPI003F67EE77